MDDLLTGSDAVLSRRIADLLVERQVAWDREVELATGVGPTDEDSAVWIEDLRRHNPGYHAERLGVYRKQVRDAMAMGGEALRTLHASALATLRRLKDSEIGEATERALNGTPILD